MMSSLICVSNNLVGPPQGGHAACVLVSSCVSHTVCGAACIAMTSLPMVAEKVTVPPSIAHSPKLIGTSPITDRNLAHRRLEPHPLQIGTSPKAHRPSQIRTLPNTHRPLQTGTSPNADRLLSFEHQSLTSSSPVLPRMGLTL